MSSGSSTEQDDDPAQSNFRLDITLSIGYQRRRARLGAVWEGSVVSIVLLAAGVAVTIYFLYAIFNLFSLRQGG